jgi:hypothetical protein
MTSRLAALLLVQTFAHAAMLAHGFGTQLTWNREISRLVFDRCASCHREGGSAFSLMTYREAQPHATAIKDAVMTRRMPPWGAVKGFGAFRNDQSLTQEQVELFAEWVQGGARRGNNPAVLPPPPKIFGAPPSVRVPPGSIAAAGEVTLRRAFTLDGLLPERVPAGSTMRIVAALPDGSVEPLLWLYEYSDRHPHAFMLRTPLRLPVGTVVRGVQPPARVVLLRGREGARRMTRGGRR